MINIFQILISKEYLHLEPIGLVFVFFFAFIIVIQFTAMLFHRFGTLSHILASTDLNLCCNKKVGASVENKIMVLLLLLTCFLDCRLKI